jgi:hypothetical protein
MRKIIDLQMKIGEKAIEEIQFDPQSRDEIPKLLRGLQAIFVDKEIRKAVFEVLKELIPPGVDSENGRKGMDLWKIFVLGTLRLNCNWDYDKVHEIANNHGNVRKMLGHSRMDEDYRYPLQTIKDNVSLFTSEISDKINQIVVKYGHKIAGKNEEEKLHGSCDSYVVETDVHFPTDINLLFDAVRTIIALMVKICGGLSLTDWRQGKHHIRKAKKFYRKAQQMKRSSSKDKFKKAEREQMIINAHIEYIDLAQSYVDKVKETMLSIPKSGILVSFQIEEVERFIAHAERQIDQIRRRIVKGESIPHHEKVFSLFEEHTEWISKGKAGVSVELGLKVCIVKDQYNFILHHRVMQNETDEKIAVLMVKETQDRYADFRSCSFDKGFHSPENHKALKELLDKTILPRKGKLSAINKEIENSEGFKIARRKHSAVESSINALENHGLDRCPDHGIEGFKRYVALAVLARNIQILGDLLQKKEIKSMRRQKRKESNAV